MIKLNTISFEDSGDLEESQFKEIYQKFVIKHCQNNNIDKLSLIYGEVFLDDNVQIQLTQSRNYENADFSDLAKLLRFDTFMVLGDRKSFCLWEDEQIIHLMFDDQQMNFATGDGWTMEDNTHQLSRTDFYDLFLEYIETDGS